MPRAAHTCPVWALGFGFLLLRLVGSYLLLEAHLTAGDLCEAPVPPSLLPDRVSIHAIHTLQSEFPPLPQRCS